MLGSNCSSGDCLNYSDHSLEGLAIAHTIGNYIGSPAYSTLVGQKTCALGSVLLRCHNAVELARGTATRCLNALTLIIFLVFVTSTYVWPAIAWLRGGNMPLVLIVVQTYVSTRKPRESCSWANCESNSLVGASPAKSRQLLPQLSVPSITGLSLSPFSVLSQPTSLRAGRAGKPIFRLSCRLDAYSIGGCSNLCGGNLFQTASFIPPQRALNAGCIANRFVSTYVR